MQSKPYIAFPGAGTIPVLNLRKETTFLVVFISLRLRIFLTCSGKLGQALGKVSHWNTDIAERNAQRKGLSKVSGNDKELDVSQRLMLWDCAS